MDKHVQANLEAGGWKVGTAADFLEEIAAESALADVTLVDTERTGPDAGQTHRNGSRAMRARGARVVGAL